MKLNIDEWSDCHDNEVK